MDYLIVIFAYLVGAIPFGLLVGRLVGVDVRAGGSKNIGATNVTRLVGKKLGIITLVLDVVKGGLPMLMAQILGFSGLVVMACGAAAFLGHCFPVYLGFKGGKGVATALGVFLYLDGVAVSVGLAVFVVLICLFGYVSLASLAAALVIPLVIWLRLGVGQVFYLSLFVSLFIWFKHHENIRRLLQGREKSFKKRGGGGR